MTTRLQRAWTDASPGEQIRFLLDAQSMFADALAITDVGRLLGWKGPRPRQPHRNTPPELVELVQRQGHTIVAAARVLGVSVRTARRWWSGRNTPQRRHRARLQAAVTAGDGDGSAGKQKERSTRRRR